MNDRQGDSAAMNDIKAGQTIQKAIDAVLPVFKEIYGSKLSMAALYGSAATGNYVRGVSDINMLLVVKEAAPRELAEISRRAGKSIQKFKITLQVISEHELHTSADIFPIEYMEIRETMQLLHGGNLLETIDIGQNNFRHQLEAMTRGAVNELRQLIIAAGSNKKLFRTGYLEWSGRQIAVHRALLRFAGSYGGDSSNKKKGEEQQPPRDLKNIEAASVKAFHLSERPFSELQALRGGKTVERPLPESAGDMLSQYLRIIDAVDSADGAASGDRKPKKYRESKKEV